MSEIESDQDGWDDAQEKRDDKEGNGDALLADGGEHRIEEVEEEQGDEDGKVGVDVIGDDKSHGTGNQSEGIGREAVLFDIIGIG